MLKEVPNAMVEVSIIGYVRVCFLTCSINQFCVVIFIILQHIIWGAKQLDEEQNH